MQDAQCENGLPDKKDLVAKTGKMQRVHRRQNKSKCKSKKSTKNCKKSLKNMPIGDTIFALDDCFLGQKRDGALLAWGGQCSAAQC